MKNLLIAIIGSSIFLVLIAFQSKIKRNNNSKVTQQQTVLRQFDSVIVLESKSETSANISFADLNGDNNLDIVLAKGRHWPLFNKILFNNGKGEFPVAVDLGTKPDNTYSTVLADLDSDGNIDIVVSNDKDDKLIYFNNGIGVFSIAQS